MGAAAAAHHGQVRTYNCIYGGINTFRAVIGGSSSCASWTGAHIYMYIGRYRYLQGCDWVQQQLRIINCKSTQEHRIFLLGATVWKRQLLRIMDWCACGNTM